MRKQLLLFFLSITALAVAQPRSNSMKNTLRAPAYPLITIDPYTSAWSFESHLYDVPIKHWTGTDFPLLGVIMVDGKAYRFMGTEDVDNVMLVSNSEQEPWSGRYTKREPAESWFEPDFKDSSWKKGEAAFGTKENESTAKTQWGDKFIWVRRHVQLDDSFKGKKIFIEYSHDDDATIYVNGIKVVDTGNTCKKHELTELPEKAIASLKKGDNVIAAMCQNRVGNGLIDFGLVMQEKAQEMFSETAEQLSVDVQATQTEYTFACGAVILKLTFTSPLLTNNLDLMSRPVNYISYDVQSKDKKAHSVKLYFEASPQWALDSFYQKSEIKTFADKGLNFIKVGSTSQNILEKKGDDVRIDWGYFYMASKALQTSVAQGRGFSLRTNFMKGKKFVSDNSDGATTGSVKKMAVVCPLGKIKKNSGFIMLGYDDIYSIQYFGTNLRPYWNRDGKQDIVGQFKKAEAEYIPVMKQCDTFNRQLMAEATTAGGKKYAELCALAYRQAIAAHKLVEAPNGDLLFLSKENFSNGSIGTVDITYPSAPMFLLYNPELVKGLLNHIFYYSESGKWKKPFAAHDVGTYPLANGQTYGGDMPVEESGNMLILTAALAAVEGNADYAQKHWDVLTTWVDYLVKHGLDPDNQLCTDDFAGHFAHNANLSIKAIIGIASYGYLAGKLGKEDISRSYQQKARQMAEKWQQMADDGDHYRLTFDKADTWSQKYNLVWDKLLGFNLFSKDVVSKEIAYYLQKQNKYGLPLDNRATYTKTDWIMWTATLTTYKETFEKFIEPIYNFMNETPDRVPMSDWVYTDKAKQKGFQARSVVGGYFIKMLETKLKK